MAGFKALGTGAKAALLAGGAVVVAAAGYGLWSVNHVVAPLAEAPNVAAAEQPAPKAPAEPDAVAEPAPATTEDPAAEDATVAAPAAEPEAVSPPVADAPQAPDATSPVPMVPTFDVVRVESDGTAIVAGQAEPGAKVVLRVDGAEITATTADASGNFVALFVLGTSAAPRMLTMTSILPDQTESPATAEVALAPTQAPVVVAEAAPAATAPATDTAAPVAAEAEAAPQAPAALLITKEGASVLQPAAPATGPVADLSIDTISYTPAGDVQLAGHAAAGAVLRIYLDNAPLIDVAVGEDGLWASTLPPIKPGIYTLRADQLAADGKVTARFETPFKRETQDALAAATQPQEPAVEVAAAEPDVAPAAEPAADPAAEGAVAPETTAPLAADAVAEPVVVADATPAPEPTPAKPISVTVQPGFTLWGIASEQFGDGVLYVQVYAANKDKIRDPDLIYPGQVFVIPSAAP